MLSFSLRVAIPLIIAAMVGLVCERSGVINIGIEGQLLMSAFAGFFGAALTGSLILGTLFGIGTGLIMGAVFATGAVAWKMDQIISGTIINIIATKIASIHDPGAGASAVVKLKCGKQFLLALITRKSLQELRFDIGEPVFAQIKGVALMTQHDS